MRLMLKFTLPGSFTTLRPQCLSDNPREFDKTPPINYTEERSCVDAAIAATNRFSVLLRQSAINSIWILSNTKKLNRRPGFTPLRRKQPPAKARLRPVSI